LPPAAGPAPQRGSLDEVVYDDDVVALLGVVVRAEADRAAGEADLPDHRLLEGDAGEGQARGTGPGRHPRLVGQPAVAVMVREAGLGAEVDVGEHRAEAGHGGAPGGHHPHLGRFRRTARGMVSHNGTARRRLPWRAHRSAGRLGGRARRRHRHPGEPGHRAYGRAGRALTRRRQEPPRGGQLPCAR
jgi:hypothetical protein